MRLSIIAAAGLAAAVLPVLPVAAQDAAGNYRMRTVLVYGSDPCPKSTNPDEIVVCARRPEEERYRIPPAVREQEAQRVPRRDNVAEQRAQLASGRDVATGVGSGGPVGPGGFAGARGVINPVQVARTVVEGVQRATEPADD